MHEVASLETSTIAFSGIVHTQQTGHSIAQSRRKSQPCASSAVKAAAVKACFSHTLTRILTCSEFRNSEKHVDSVGPVRQDLIEPVHLAGVEQRLEALSCKINRLDIPRYTNR